MPHRTSRVTSPNNAMAVVIYFASAYIGICTMFDIMPVKSMLEFHGPMFVDIWGGAALVAGSIAGCSAMLTRMNPRSFLLLELYATGLMFPTWAFYEVTLVRGNGITAVQLTQALAIGFSLGALARFIQIALEVRKTRRSVHRDGDQCGPTR